MKKLFVIISFIIITLFADCNAKSFENLIIGFWTTSFPVSDEMYGYIFDVEGNFYYWDEADYNIKYQYDGSMGQWKIENNKIMIKIIYDILWKSKWFRDAHNTYDPGEENRRFIVKHNDINWHPIGDIRLYSESKSYNDGKDFGSVPETILFNPIMNKEIVQSQRYYVRVCVFNDKRFISLCNYPMNIIKAFKKLKE